MNNEDQKSYKPDWVPENAGKEFAVRVVKAIPASQKNGTKAVKKTQQYTVDQLVDGVLKNDRTILARTVTLIESKSEQHQQKSSEVLNKLIPYIGKSIRIGITGVPGAGKSTLIETFGLYLIEKGHKIAVLTIDPSSSVTKGSILGDKTRMEKLSRENNCFIRPSPSGGTLGGVARKTRETISVCEAAGYDVIIIETVGVGQSEVTVRSMVDFFLLVLIAGAGDELQGIKKGVMELADAILINKADGDNIQKANLSRADYENALHYLQPATAGWTTMALICSALTGNGIPEIWEMIKNFKSLIIESGEFEKRRKEQALEWMYTLIEDSLKQKFYNNGKIRSMLAQIKEEVRNGKILPTIAAEKLLKSFDT